jgi:hypothetical protein
MLLSSVEQGNLFDKACVRWLGRFTLEVPGLSLEGAHLAPSALSTLGRGSAAGAHALADLFDELERSDLTSVTETWLERRR